MTLVSMLMLVVSACATATSPVTPSAPPGCSEVDVVFARGTNQPPGLGRVGAPFLRALTAGLPGRTVNAYPVDYAADSTQNFGPGATDIARHLRTVAAHCPRTRFVLGGYSQGALAVSYAIGLPVQGATAETIPPALSGAVAAVVVFGNPLGASGRSIDSANVPFRAQSREYCNSGDAVCGRRGPLAGTHRDYPTNGATDQAAAFAVGRVAP